jgi:hypothetical protein
MRAKGAVAILQLFRHSVEGSRKLPQLPDLDGGGHLPGEIPRRQAPGSPSEGLEGANQALPHEVGEEHGQEEGRQGQEKGLPDPGPNDPADPVQRNGHLQKEILAGERGRCRSKEPDLHLPGPTSPGEAHVPGQGLSKLRALHRHHETPELEGQPR